MSTESDAAFADADPARPGRETGRRRATVLFADITGFTSLVEQAGDEEAYEIIGACLRLLDALVVKHGGHVEKHAGDCVVAVFGAPVALANAPCAAVEAALEMRRAIRDYNRRRGITRPLEVHTGIDTGPVIADARRSAGPSDLPIFGDVVNVAARLKDDAPAGEIWVGPGTFEETRGDFEYRPLAALTFEGRQDAVPSFAVLTADERGERTRTDDAFAAPLLGRETEFESLCAALAALARGESRVVSITGATGLGKTRLVAELRARPEATAFAWLECRPTSDAPLHIGIAGLVRRWAGIDAADGPAALPKLTQTITRLLGDAAVDSLPFLATLLGLRLGGDERRRVQAEPDTTGATQRAVVRFFAGLAAERPLVVVFEDLQAVDAASVDLLRALLRPGAVAPALFLLAATDLARVRSCVGAERPDLVAIEVRPLAPASAAELVARLLARTAAPAALGEAIAARVAGHPLFAEEAVRLLADATVPDVAQIPDTLEASIRMRVEALPAESRAALESAAAIGPHFWVPMLAFVIGTNELGEVLPALADGGYLVAGDEQEWSFRHPLIREVVQTATSPTRREALQRRVGEAIELGDTARRRATALFADVTGFAAFAEHSGEQGAYDGIGACLRLLDAIVVKHGGHVEKHLGDCVVAVFGAPLAIENAPRAAVNAALEMRKAVRDYAERLGVPVPLEVHAGVNTGSVISDPRKSAGTSDLPVFGDVVNIASRLKDKAPAGEIWVGPETWRATRDDFEYRPLAPLALKGKRETVSVYALLTSEERLHRRRAGTAAISSPMVGREPEVETIRERLAALAGGVSGVVTVIAEPGLGKSRLLGEVQALPDAAAATWLEGRSLSTGQGQHHHPFVDLLRGWAGIGPDEVGALAKLSTALEGVLGSDAADVLPFLATLLNVRPAEADLRRLESIQDEARARLLERAVVLVFAALAKQRPLVLVFEDLHWADGSSIELLCELLRLGAVSPVLFLLASRPQHADTTGRVLERLEAERPDALRIVLAPLAGDAVAQLVDNLFAGGHVPLATREAILSKVAGNPFFAEEVVRAFVDDGAVEVRGGRLFATDRIHAAVIPGTVEEAIQARLDHLPSERRRTLETAAVIGITFWEPVLAEVLGEKRQDEILAALADAGLVVPAGGQEWSFKHPLVQEVTYGTTLRARREDLHRRVGEAIEGWMTDRTPGYHAMLAFHFGRGRDLERAEEYLFRAGAEAARSSASNEALRFFRDAAGLYFQLHGEGGDPAKKAQLEKHLGMALMNRGQLGEAVERFGTALAHLGDAVSYEPAKLYRRLVWDLANVVLRLYLPRRGLRLAATAVQREQIDIRFRRGLAQTTTAPGPVILADTVATLRRLERIDPNSVPEAGGIYSGAIAIFSYGGVSFELGRRILERAREVVEGGNVRETLLYYRLMRWIHFYLSGDWSPDYDIDEELLEEGLRYGRLWEVQTFLDLDAERCLYRGDWDGATHRLAALASFNEQFRHGTAIAAHRALTAYLHLERRELPEALAAIDRYYRDHAEASFQLQALGMMAKIHALGGDLAAAGQALGRAEDLVERAGEQPPFHRSRFDLARLFVDVARLDAAAGSGGDVRTITRSALRARRDAARGAAKVAARRPEVFRLAGTLAMLRGRRGEALGLWEKSATAAEALGMGPELARTWLEVAQRGAGLRGRDAGACRSEALRLFAAHGLAAEGAAATAVRE